MATFKLEPNPTFKAIVMIPVPGDKSAPVEFIFKHRTKDAYEDMIKRFSDAGDKVEDVDVVLEIASGWALVEPFDKANILKMLQNYMGAKDAIAEAYVREITGARLGNFAG
jgi:hypothetical protein